MIGLVSECVHECVVVVYILHVCHMPYFKHNIQCLYLVSRNLDQKYNVTPIIYIQKNANIIPVSQRLHLRRGHAAGVPKPPAARGELRGAVPGAPALAARPQQEPAAGEAQEAYTGVWGFVLGSLGWVQ